VSGAALESCFGIGVRQLREARGWSQERLAEHAELNRSYIGEIERGDVTASLATVAKLAGALNMEPSALVGRGEQIGALRAERGRRLMAIGG
jgi:transcriptional regulator with XRE-family HTH domain